MPETRSGWLVEEGIGEHRAIRLHEGRIVAAQIHWPGRLAAGDVVEARLITRAAGQVRGTARTAEGQDILVDRLPRDAAEGAVLTLAITRASLQGPGRFKRAQGRPSDARPARQTLARALDAQLVHRFPDCDWDELMGEVLAAEISFPGGTLLFAPTPAMTTADIDGALPPPALAAAAVPALASAIRRFDLAGSVAIDFPTLPDKADRRAVDEALAAALGDWPHERTAMNGFGLVQIVSRLERPSLLHLATWQRPALVWRQLMRRAERLEGQGGIELTMHPSLEPAVEPAHLAELERRTGARVRIRTSATTAPGMPHAQRVPDA